MKLKQIESTSIPQTDDGIGALGERVYSFSEAMADLFDNSYGASEEGEVVTITVIATYRPDQSVSNVKIEDDARGIRDLKRCLQIGKSDEYPTSRSLNKFGVGMKAVISNLSKRVEGETSGLEYIHTVTKDESHVRVINSISVEPFCQYVDELPKYFDHGTKISINIAQSRNITTADINSLSHITGVKYAKFLNNGSLKIIIKRSLEGDDRYNETSNVYPIFPSYYHPKKKNNELISTKLIIGEKYHTETLTTFGIKGSDKELEPIGIEAPGKNHYYSIHLNTGGMQVMFRGRNAFEIPLGRLLGNSEHNFFNRACCFMYPKGAMERIFVASKNDYLDNEIFKEYCEAFEKAFAEEIDMYRDFAKSTYGEVEGSKKTMYHESLKNAIYAYYKNGGQNVTRESIPGEVDRFSDIKLENRLIIEVKTGIGDNAAIYQACTNAMFAGFSETIIYARSFKDSIESTIDVIIRGKMFASALNPDGIKKIQCIELAKIGL